jgi:ATP-dependent Lhr-like helicase
LSSALATGLRLALEHAGTSNGDAPLEIERIQPLLAIQAARSVVPARHETLVEAYTDEDGAHVAVFPFAGRAVHEALAMVCAHRLSLRMPRTFTWACNDYGFELLTDAPWPVQELLGPELLRTEGLSADILNGVNAAELARRRFRDISVIAGLTFAGFPGAPVKDRHLSTHAGLLFEVLADHDPGNRLLQQAYDELLAERFEWGRLLGALEALRASSWVYRDVGGPTPLSFPLAVDRLRERLSSERMEDRIRRMVAV